MADAHVERLLAELGERANAELAQAEAAARERADAVREAARRRAEAARTAIVAAAEAEEAARRAAAVANAQAAARGALLEAQHAFVARVRDAARARVTARLASAGDSEHMRARITALEAFAMTKDVRVERGPGGLELVADGRHLRIADDVDAWLAAEAPQIALDACRALEEAA